MGLQWCCLPGEAEVDLAFDVGPFFGLSQPPHQFFKGRCVFGGELKPGQEVEGFSEVTAVVQPPGDGREVLQPGGDVMGAFLEDPPAFVFRQRVAELTNKLYRIAGQLDRDLA